MFVPLSNRGWKSAVEGICQKDSLMEQVFSEYRTDYSEGYITYPSQEEYKGIPLSDISEHVQDYNILVGGKVEWSNPVTLKMSRFFKSDMKLDESYSLLMENMLTFYSTKDVMRKIKDYPLCIPKKEYERLTDLYPGWLKPIDAAPYHAQKQIIAYFRLEDWQLKIDDYPPRKEANAPLMYATIPDDEMNILLFNRAMSFFGYFPGLVDRSIKCNPDLMDYVRIQYEPKIQDRINEEIRKMKYLYHVSEESHEKKILSKGLVPRSSNPRFDYPSRIYAIREDAEPDRFDRLLKYIATLLNEPKKHTDKTVYNVYRIDISKVPERVNFHRDYNMYPIAVFTADNIPPSAISVYKKIEV